ncbi:asparagine synthase (glutamine-hydrolyzing) [Cellvibrio sp. PSBB023]|nr:asparagine synthase (glutamine-hydrolyzing) [Cellvibrio sp. PSBB023]
MCGYAGMAVSSKSISVLTPELLGVMGDSIRLRGPDDQGMWLDSSLRLGLVHQRLAIQDLSPLGAQPMHSIFGRYTIAFNGEIYNFKQLKARLVALGFQFKGGSDTEVILAAFEAWGIESALIDFIGMFSIALVDHQEKKLWLIRDRVGEKPLYYYQSEGNILFASELKPLLLCPLFKKEIEPGAVGLLMRHNYIPAPWSIFKNTFKLEPAHYLCFNLVNTTEAPIKKCYWNPSLKWDHSLNAQSLHERLDPLLRQVIADQMISDAPLGAFLSGGIDSSTIVSLMQQQSSRPVKTFSVGFNVAGFNEAEHAKAVASHLGTDHSEFYVQPADALDIIPRLPDIYDEPFADSSQIPTFIVSRMTRQQVTVALSGDGGDELFAGYSRYASYDRGFTMRRQGLAHKLMNHLPAAVVAQLTRLGKVNQRDLSLQLVLEKVLRYKASFNAASPQAFYQNQVGYWLHPEAQLTSATRLAYALDNMPVREDPTSTFQWCDINSYLPDDILVKVDRAAMANSLETRVPLLDHRLVELSLTVPTGINVVGGVTKQPLRKILYQHVPRELVDRPKQGFAVPVAHWLKNELRDWAEDLLSEKSLADTGIFNSDLIRQKWHAHLTSSHDYSFHLWSVLMFQSWYRKYI